MAEQHGQAGRSTRTMELRRYVLWSLTLIAVLGLCFLLLRVVPETYKVGTTPRIALCLGLIIGLKFVVGRLESTGRRVKRAERRAARGAVGEENVGRILGGLPDDWVVWHDVTSPYGNIDHVVLSRTRGLFIVETKSHSGRVAPAADGQSVVVNRRAPEKDFVGQCHRNAIWLRDHVRSELGIAPWVTAVLVFSRAYVEVRRPVRGVQVVNAGYLLKFLDRCPERGEAEHLWQGRAAIERLCGR
jgi:hypothetical protein